MAQYVLPATVSSTNIILGASESYSAPLPLRPIDKNILVVRVNSTTTNCFIIFAATALALAPANGMRLTADDTFVLAYDANSKFFMLYTTAGGVCNVRLFVNGYAP